MSKKKYKNETHRMMNDVNWDGSDDGYQYTGPKKLTRNKIDGILGGVCAGLFVLSVIFFGLPFFVYFILWIFIPKDTRAPYIREYRQSRRAYRESPSSPVRTTTFKDVKSKYRSLETRYAAIFVT